MQNMWNSINNNFLVMGHNQMFGPSTIQKRQFGFDFPNVGNISVGKYFKNPNFVNKDYPRIHNYEKNNLAVQSTLACQFDISKNKNSSFTDASFINPSQSIIETIKEKHLDVVQPVHNLDLKIQTTEISCQNKPEMCNKRTRKNRRRHRKGHSCKNPGKSSKNIKKEINEMMEIDTDPHITNFPEINNSPQEHHSLILFDFLCNKQSKVDADNATDEEDIEYDMADISYLPKMDCKLRRERTVSLAESEDSFIVFESGTDDELEFSENSQDEDESEEDTDEDELDSSPSVVPRKKVSRYSYTGCCVDRWVIGNPI